MKAEAKAARLVLAKTTKLGYKHGMYEGDTINMILSLANFWSFLLYYALLYSPLIQTKLSEWYVIFVGKLILLPIM